MKIVHVINRCSIANGAAKLLLDIVPHQKSLGHQVDILALVAVNPSYKDQFEQIGCNYITILKEGKSVKSISLSLLLRIKEIIRQYDIVHAHLFPSFYWVALIKYIFKIKAKIVFTEHNSENNRRKKWLIPIERFIYRQYNAIIAISDAVRDNLLSFLKIRLPIQTVLNGINIEQFKNASPLDRLQFKIPEDSFVLTQVSRFGPEKDQMTLIKALKLLPSNIHLVLVGNGPLLSNHISEVNNLQLEDRVHFLGLRNDIPQIMQMSDIVILSSHFEGFGLVAVEGMAAKKPLIASNVPGLNQVVQGAGLLFEKYNLQELTGHILELLNNRDYYTKIAEQCYNRSLTYDIVNVVKQYDDIYNSLI